MSGNPPLSLSEVERLIDKELKSRNPSTNVVVGLCKIRDRLRKGITMTGRVKEVVRVERTYELRLSEEEIRVLNAALWDGVQCVAGKLALPKTTTESATWQERRALWNDLRLIRESANTADSPGDSG